MRQCNLHYLIYKIMEINKVYNMDCMVGMKGIKDKSVDLILTDAPYWHKKSPGKPYSERKQCNTASSFSNSHLFNADGFMMKEMSDFGEEQINAVLKEFVRVCKIPNMYIFCNETQVPYYAMWAEKNNLMFSILVWEKPLSIINKNRFSQNIEFIVRIYDYGTALNKVDGLNFLYNRVKKVKPVNHTEKIHPTQKPISLFEEFIILSSNVGDVVLDAFCGSGTTAIACLNQNRNFICFEKSEEYAKLANERIAASRKQLKLF